MDRNGKNIKTSPSKLLEIWDGQINAYRYIMSGLKTIEIKLADGKFTAVFQFLADVMILLAGARELLRNVDTPRSKKAGELMAISSGSRYVRFLFALLRL